jgi:hypothetical protein
MKREFLRDHGKNGFELIEEAFVVLRSCPPWVLALYFIGSTPFVAGFLVYWSMACNDPHAREFLVPWSFGLTGLFVWMKFFQNRFCSILLARLGGSDLPQWSSAVVFRSVINQTILQSTGFLLLPISALIALPFGWVYAFYQNATILDDGTTGTRQLTKQAIRQSQLWPLQNHLLLFVLPAFGLFVFFNWATLILILPQILRMFFGVESAFSQSPMAMLNSTFFAAMLGFTYLSLDPLIKTCYVLRCFYGKSLSTGADLRMSLSRLARVSAVILILFLGGISPAFSQGNDSAEPAITTENLDQAITRVSQNEKYSWREAGVQSEAKNGGVLENFFRAVVRFFGQVIDVLGDLAAKLMKWIFGKSGSPEEDADNSSWMTPQLGLLYGALAIVAALLAVAVMRFLRRRKEASDVMSQPIPAMPDVSDEQTGADELPENEWFEMGRELAGRGDLRLALRAYYLALLAHLAGRSLVSIARHKTNYDYERELGRRGHALPEILPKFRDNVSIINSTWYGSHEVRVEMIGHFVANIEEIRRAT